MIELDYYDHLPRAHIGYIFLWISLLCLRGCDVAFVIDLIWNLGFPGIDLLRALGHDMLFYVLYV